MKTLANLESQILDLKVEADLAMQHKDNKLTKDSKLGKAYSDAYERILFIIDLINNGVSTEDTQQFMSTTLSRYHTYKEEHIQALNEDPDNIALSAAIQHYNTTIEVYNEYRDELIELSKAH